MLCKVDTAKYSTWKPYTTYVVHNTTSNYALCVNKTNTIASYTVSAGKYELSTTLNINSTGYGDPITFSLYKDDTYIKDILSIQQSSGSWTGSVSYVATTGGTYTVRNRQAALSGTQRPDGTLAFRYREIKDFNYKSIRVYEVKNIWIKAVAYLFGMLPDGTRRNGN